MSNRVVEPKCAKNTAPWGATAEDDQWEGFEEFDEAKGKDAKRAPQMTNAGMDAHDIKLKPKGPRNKDCKDVSPKQATSKAVVNPFDPLTQVNDDTNDAADEIDGKEVRVPVCDSAYQ